MKRLLTGLLVAGAVGMLPHPVPADAQTSWVKCVNQSVESCNRDFAGDSWYAMSVRGYCYAIRSSICKAVDKY
jgi:hypothetical protein